MSRAKGNIAEERAYSYLVELGYTIIEQNFYSRFGEIDIIAIKDNTLHFIEVKSAKDYELAMQNMTKSKIFKIVRTSQVYIKKNSISIDYMLDVVIVTPREIFLVDNITI